MGKEYSNWIKKYPVLKKEEEKKLLKKAQKGNKEALEILICSNVRLVFSMAQKYQKKELDFEDLVQEGIIGLTEAVKKFDLKTDYKFSTYAVYWITQAINRASANTGSLIRIPVHMNDLMAKINKKKQQVKLEGKKLSNAQLDKELGLLEGTAEKVEDLKKRTVFFWDKSNPTKSEDGLIGDTLASPLEENPDIITEKSAFINDIDKMLSLLKKREKEVLIARFGLFGTKQKTLAELGKEMGCTRERIRQIEKTALTVLRKKCNWNGMKDWIA